MVVCPCAVCAEVNLSFGRHGRLLGFRRQSFLSRRQRWNWTSCHRTICAVPRDPHDAHCWLLGGDSEFEGITDPAAVRCGALHSYINVCGRLSIGHEVWGDNPNRVIGRLFAWLLVARSPPVLIVCRIDGGDASTIW